MVRFRKCVRVLLIIGTLAPPILAKGALNDVFPGDYLAGPAGLTAFSTYLYQRSWSGIYTDGRSNRRREIDNQVAVVLVAHYFDTKGQRMLLSASGGVASSKLKDSGTSDVVTGSGAFDPKIGWTIWPLHREGAPQQLALSVSYIPPWGEYTPGRVINMGQNRARTIASVSWSIDATPSFRVEATTESAFFGKNRRLGTDRDTLEQDPAHALTVYGRHLTSGPAAPYIGLQENWGGETRVNGAPQGGSVESSRLMVGVRASPSSNQILHLRYARDIRTSYGMGLVSELVVRWTLLQ